LTVTILSTPPSKRPCRARPYPAVNIPGVQNKEFVHGDVSLAYTDTGAADGEVALFLHGVSSNRRTWDWMVSKIAGRMRVLAYDHRGHGGSSHVPRTYTLEYYVSDAMAFCDNVIGRPSVIVGHSLGGIVALSVAQRRPELVRALLVEDPPLVQTRAENRGFFSLLHQAISEMHDRGAPVDEYESMMRVVPSPNGAGSFADVLGPDGTRARAEGLARVDPDVFLPLLDGSAMAAATPDALIKCPLVVLRADPRLGATFTAEDEARLLSVDPQAQVKMIEGASHFIHDEQPERVLAELDALLDAL
jgi:pimeloyl-ACP methyl ester carboxylesterase